MVRRLLRTFRMKRLACCALALVACAGNDAREISDQEYDDLALSLASTLRTSGGGGEVGAFADVLAIAGGKTPAGFTQDEIGGFHGSRSGLIYSYAVACRDDHNRGVPCTVATDNADAHITWSGTVALPQLVLTVERDGDWMLNDLENDMVRIDGFGTLSGESRITSADRASTTYQLSYVADHRAVIFANSEIWPRGGLGLYKLVAERTRTTDNTEQSREIELDAEVRFSAGGKATIRLDDTRRYDVDLATGGIVAY